MNTEFFAAIEQLEKEKGIPQDYMLERVAQALLAAYKRDNSGVIDNVFVEPDCEKKTFRMYVKKTVVEAVENPGEEISLDEAKKVSKRAGIGDVISIEIEPAHSEELRHRQQSRLLFRVSAKQNAALCSVNSHQRSTKFLRLSLCVPTRATAVLQSR